MRVVVIGAGLGGLSAAAHLVGRGHDVLVLERGSVPGGRAGVLAEDGFRLQTGPTVLTMPELLAHTFAAAGAEMDRYVTIGRVDPMFRAVYPDGSVLHMRHDRAEMTEEIRRFANARDAGAFNEFCDWLTELYEVEMRHFIDVNDDSLMQLAKRWRALTELFRLGGFSRLGRRLASFFEDERLRRVFSFQSMYAGIASDDALALYAVMTYMGSVGGVFAPQGGMHAVAAGRRQACHRNRVDPPVGGDRVERVARHHRKGAVEGIAALEGELRGIVAMALARAHPAVLRHDHRHRLVGHRDLGRRHRGDRLDQGAAVVAVFLRVVPDLLQDQLRHRRAAVEQVLQAGVLVLEFRKLLLDLEALEAGELAQADLEDVLSLRLRQSEGGDQRRLRDRVRQRAAAARQARLVALWVIQGVESGELRLGMGRKSGNPALERKA